MVLEPAKSSSPCDCGGLSSIWDAVAVASLETADTVLMVTVVSWWVCLALYLGNFLCWFCLNLLEHRGPPSGTNSARQSPAPQHRPLGSAQINPSGADRYGAFGFGKRTENSQKSLTRGVVNAKVTSTSFYLCVGELRKVKLEKKFQIVTGFPGPSISTWHSLMLALLQLLVAVIPRYR